MDYTYSWEGFKEASLIIESHNFFETEDASSIVTEAWKRIFVSRLYYACFHKAIEVAEEITSYKKIPEDLGFYYNRHKAHGDILTFYKRLSKEYPLPKLLKHSSYTVSMELKKLHDMRKDCDYTKNLPELYVTSCCTQSKVFAETIEANVLALCTHFQSKIRSK